MLTPDGLLLGPLSLSWSALTLLAGLLTWSALARFAGAGMVLGVTLLVARLWAAWPGLSPGRPLLENLLDVFDLRRGDWAWGPGLLAGLAALLRLGWPRRAFPAGSARAFALGVLAGLLPQVLRPSAAQALTVPPQSLAAVTAQESRPAAPLPRPTLLNFWATWCGPCRAELPLLEDAARAKAAVTLVNVGEPAQTVQRFLSESELSLPTRVGGDALAAQLGVTAFPTTIVVGPGGEVLARHLGPLSAAQLRSMLKQVETP